MQYVYFFSSAILLQTKIAFYLAHELEINIYHDDRLLIYIDNLYDKKKNNLLRELNLNAKDTFDKIKFEAIKDHSVHINKVNWRFVTPSSNMFGELDLQVIRWRQITLWLARHQRGPAWTESTY